MRTFGILAGGWVVGGLVIMLLTAANGTPVKAAPVKGAPVNGATADREVGGPADRRSALREPVVRESARESAQRASVHRASSDTPILIPVVGVTPDQLMDTFTQARGGGRTHRALDILAPKGTPVVAAVDGTIRKLFFSKSGGITIYQFDGNEERVYYYAHLDRYANDIAEGLFVEQGRVIGYVGTTGNAPPGTPHLHFSIEVLPPTKEWWGGSPVNPYPLLMGGAATTRVSALP